MIEISISNEEITNKMFFIREENSNQPIAVIKVGDLMKFKRPHGYDSFRHFCPNCGAKMGGKQP